MNPFAEQYQLTSNTIIQMEVKSQHKTQSSWPNSYGANNTKREMYPSKKSTSNAIVVAMKLIKFYWRVHIAQMFIDHKYWIFILWTLFCNHKVWSLIMYWIKFVTTPTNGFGFNSLLGHEMLISF
jgi:hypothetical protein